MSARVSERDKSGLGVGSASHKHREPSWGRMLVVLLVYLSFLAGGACIFALAVVNGYDGFAITLVGLVLFAFLYFMLLPEAEPEDVCNDYLHAAPESRSYAYQGTGADGQTQNIHIHVNAEEKPKASSWDGFFMQMMMYDYIFGSQQRDQEERRYKRSHPYGYSSDLRGMDAGDSQAGAFLAAIGILLAVMVITLCAIFCQDNLSTGEIFARLLLALSAIGYVVAYSCGYVDRSEPLFILFWAIVVIASGSSGRTKRRRHLTFCLVVAATVVVLLNLTLLWTPHSRLVLNNAPRY